jgi:hypothetical protein
MGETSLLICLTGGRLKYVARWRFFCLFGNINHPQRLHNRIVWLKTL